MEAALACPLPCDSCVIGHMWRLPSHFPNTIKATAPQHERYSETLAKCQRYFEGVPAGSTFNQGDAICWSGYALINGTNYATKAFTVEKRAIPTVVMTDNTVIAGFNAATCAVGQAGTRGIRGSAQATGTVGARYFFLHFTADAEL